MEIRVSRHADVTAVLSDPGYVVPAAEGGPPGTLAWLRATVSRFTEGTTHGRRRAIVVEELARLSPAALRRAAHDLTAEILDAAGHETLAEALEAVARPVPTRVLGRALGVSDLDALAAAVPVAAAVYLTGSDRPEPDQAVATLVRLLTPSGSNDSDTGEVTAARIAVLMQSCEATATLIGKAAHLALDRPEAAGRPIESIIAETLRFDPPVPAMRRVTAADHEPPGETVVLDIAAANRDPDVFTDPDTFDPARAEPAHLTYGAGRRPCPGAAHANGLAAGVVEAIRQRFGSTTATRPDGK